MAGYQRQEYYEPSRVNTGQAEVYNTLADRLQEFSQNMGARGTRIAIREGARQGAEAGQRGTPLLRSEATIAGQAYNDSAMRTYIARATHDIETNLARLEDEAGHNLDLYDATSEGSAKGLIDSAPAWAKPDLGVYLGQRIAEGRIRVAHQARAFDNEEDRVAVLAVLGPLGDSAAKALASPDPGIQAEGEARLTHGLAMIAGAVNSGTFGPSHGFELGRRFEEGVRAGVQTAKIDGVVNDVMTRYRADIGAGDAALSAIEAREDVTPNDLAEIRSKVNSQLGVLYDERRRQNVDALAGLERDLAGDRASARTARLVEDLYEDGALTPSQAAEYHGQIEGGIRRRTAEDAEAQALQAALASGEPLDPANAEHRKALAQSYSRDLQGGSPGSEVGQQLAIAYAGKTRMLPSQATAWVRQAIRSPDPNVAARAAQFYGAVQAAVPDASDGFDTDTRAFAGTVSSMLEVGTDPERAVETARALVYDVKPELRERRTAEYRQLAKNTDAALMQFADRDFDPGWFASAPAASAGLKADFAVQSERYYQKTGDFTLATDLAWRDLKRVYGPSAVNGESILMAFPVERFGVSPEEVRQDIGNFLKGNPQASGVGADSIRVVADSLTLRRVNDAMDGSPIRPSYRLVTSSGDLVVDRHGIPSRYTIPTVEELTVRLKAAEQEAHIAAEAEVAAARKERAERQLRRQQHQDLGLGIKPR